MTMRTVIRAGVLALVVLAPAGAVQSAEAPAGPGGAADGFATRRAAALDAVWAGWRATTNRPGGPNRFYRAMALFEAGHVAEGRALAHRGLDLLTPGNRENRWLHGGNSGFVAWPGIDCYIRCERHMDAELKERFRRIYTGAVFYPRLSTSNHKIMAAVTRYLATQTWGADAFRPDPAYEAKHAGGSVFAKDDPSGEKYVRRIIADTVAQGPGEYASRPYGSENVLPLLTLAECARDESVRKPARLAYEYALIQLAPAWLDGHLATFSPRSYPDAERQQPRGVAAVAWTAFGGLAPRDVTEQTALRALVGRHDLPAPVLAAAADRTRPYVHRALVTKWALYHFVNRDYALFSRSPKAGGPGFQGQGYPCGVMWRDPDPERVSQLWITNPAADDNAAATNAPRGLHTHGVTKYEQEVQHRDALLFVFDIPADFRNPYVLGFIPGGARAVVNDAAADGRIFLHYGSVLIAIAASQPFAWDPAGGIRAPTGTPAPGDSEFRIPALRTAVAIETAHPSEFPGAAPAAQLDAFRTAVLARSRIAFTAGAKAAGAYTDRAGNRLVCEFDGTDRINDSPVDYAAWPALENPWMTRMPGGPLVVRDGARVVRYDFGTWERKEQEP